MFLEPSNQEYFLQARAIRLGESKCFVVFVIFCKIRPNAQKHEH